MIKQIEFYTLDISGIIVKKWSMVCLPSATGKAVPIRSRYFETVSPAPVPPPPTASLVAEKKSRFLSESQIQEN